jgi:hypothetical protein
MALEGQEGSSTDAAPAVEGDGTTLELSNIEVTETVVDPEVGSLPSDAEVSPEWVFDLSDGLADDVAQAANEIAAGQFRPSFLLPVIAASIGAAYIGIWIGDRILPFGRTTVGKAAGAALGTLLADVISRKVRN